MNSPLKDKLRVNVIFYFILRYGSFRLNGSVNRNRYAIPCIYTCNREGEFCNLHARIAGLEFIK